MNIEVVGGHIGSIEVNIPWTAILSEDSFFEVKDLCMTLRPKSRPTDGTSVLESMWSSVSSSMQIAQECVNREEEIASIIQEANGMEGLEHVAQTIDNGKWFLMTYWYIVDGSWLIKRARDS